MNSKKLLERIRKDRNNVRFSDLERLLTDLGFQLDRVNGSHCTYIHAYASNITIQPDQNNQAKNYQLKQVLTMIDIYGLKLED